MYTLPAVAWNTEAAFLDHIAMMKSLNINAWEFAGGYPTVNGRQPRHEPGRLGDVRDLREAVRVPHRRHARRPERPTARPTSAPRSRR